MFGRIQPDGLSVPVTSVQGATARADLAVTPVGTSVDLPETAVAGVSDVQQTGMDRQSADVAAAVGQIGSNMTAASDNEAAAKKLAEIRAKLVLGYKDLTSTTVPPDAATKAERALEDLQAAVMQHPLRGLDIQLAGSDIGAPDPATTDASAPAPSIPQVDLQPLPKTDSTDQSAQSVQNVGPADRARVLTKIKTALQRIDRLQSALETNKSSAYDRIVALSASVSGLNSARTAVNDSAFGLDSASRTVDSIMGNVRAAVLSHGKVSAEVAGLVL